MDAVDVEVITYAPTAFYHCQHCEIAFDQIDLGARIHREQAASALPDDLAEDFALLASRIGDLHRSFGDRVRVRVVDAASIEGFVRSLRRRIRTYPAVLIDGARCDPGDRYEGLHDIVARALESKTSSKAVPGT